MYDYSVGNIFQGDASFGFEPTVIEDKYGLVSWGLYLVLK